jgi:hypothetical protein
MLRYQLGGGVTLPLFLQLVVDPPALGAIEDGVDAGLARRLPAHRSTGSSLALPGVLSIPPDSFGS